MKYRWMATSALLSVVMLGSYGVVTLLSEEARPNTPSAPLGMKLNAGQLDLTVQSPLQITLRSNDGRQVKAIEAKENGTTVVTSFHKDGSRFLSIQDSFDGAAQLVILGTDKERVSLQINKDGSIQFNVLGDAATTLAKPVLPTSSDAVPLPAPALSEPPAETNEVRAPEVPADITGTTSILQKKKDDK